MIRRHPSCRRASWRGGADIKPELVNEHARFKNTTLEFKALSQILETIECANAYFTSYASLDEADDDLDFGIERDNCFCRFVTIDEFRAGETAVAVVG